MAAPGLLPVLGEKECIWQLVSHLVFKKGNPVRSQNDIAHAEFRRTPFAVGKFERLSIEITNLGGSKQALSGAPR
jgi:hypothetical protein